MTQTSDSILWTELQKPEKQTEASKQLYSAKDNQYDFKPGKFLLGQDYTKRIVVPKTKKENITWPDEDLPDIERAVHEVDNKHALLQLPKNKGNEFTIYLRYIIDHYDNLTDVNVCIHAVE